MLGRNGSGKSSLMRIIFGTLKADFKHLKINGKLVDKPYTTGEVAYLPQESFLPPFIMVKDIFRTVTGIDKWLIQNEFISNLYDQKIGNLSGGELRFIECLWILSLPAKYIMLDEPFSGISPIMIERLQDLIRKASVNKAIVLTDHSYRPLLEISNRVVLLHNNSVYTIKNENDLIHYHYIPSN